MKSYLLLILLTFLSSSLSIAQQNYKTGYVDYQAVYHTYTQLADIKSKNQQSINARKQFEEEFEAKKKDLNKRYMQAYQAAQVKHEFTLTPAVNAPAKAASNFDTAPFEAEYKKLMKDEQSKRNELTKKEQLDQVAIGSKIQKAIQEVASEKGYKSVMNTAGMLYFSAEDDLTQLVLKKLGL